MGMLLLRSLGVLVAFQLLALAVVAAGTRGHATRVALALVAVLAGMGVTLGSVDPAAGCCGAVVAGWAVQRAVRRGFGFGRASLWGLLPVVLATALNTAGSNPRQAWADLQTQVDVIAGVDAKSVIAPGVSPEERVLRERYQALATSAAHWALRLLPAEIVVFGWLQVLVIVIGARRIAFTSGEWVALSRPSQWQVPFVWIWVLVAGLVLMVLHQDWSMTVGGNVVTGVVAVLAVQGAAVALAAVERSAAQATGAMRFVIASLFVVAAVLMWPLLMTGLALLGAADLWVDFRRLRPAGDDA
jgi:hypothetical protein